MNLGWAKLEYFSQKTDRATLSTFNEG